MRQLRCPLCENEIETEKDVVNGQHIVCPYCDKKFTCFTNEEPNKPKLPIVIASGDEFERFLCREINALSCAKCEQTKASGDQGVDLIATLKDGKKIAIQCKLYSTPVGNDAVQQVVAGRIFYKCDMAAVVTNSTYTQSALDLANASGVSLLHYSQITDFIANEGGSSLTKSDYYYDFMRQVEAGHPNWYSELSFLWHYGMSRRWSARPRDMIAHMKCVLEGLIEDGRHPMRETVWLLNLLVWDACVEIEADLQHGKFGKTLARIYESYETSGRTADYLTLDFGGEAALAHLIDLCLSLSQIHEAVGFMRENKNFKEQIFKDQLPIEFVHVIEELFDIYDDKEFAEHRDGQANEWIIESRQNEVAKLFGTTWPNLVTYSANFLNVQNAAGNSATPVNG